MAARKSPACIFWRSRRSSGCRTLTYGKTANKTAVVVVLLGALAIYTSAQVKIGNPVEGSNLLWYQPEFNTAVRAINAHFPGMNTLEIILEARSAI